MVKSEQKKFLKTPGVFLFSLVLIYLKIEKLSQSVYLTQGRFRTVFGRTRLSSVLQPILWHIMIDVLYEVSILLGILNCDYITCFLFYDLERTSRFSVVHSSSISQGNQSHWVYFLDAGFWSQLSYTRPWWSYRLILPSWSPSSVYINQFSPSMTCRVSSTTEPTN